MLHRYVLLHDADAVDITTGDITADADDVNRLFPPQCQPA